MNADAIADAVFGPTPTITPWPDKPQRPAQRLASNEAAAVKSSPARQTSPASAAAKPGPPIPLLGDDWTAATVDGLLAVHPELQLDADEATRLKDVYVTCQNVRTAYEAEIAEVLSITANRARIRIPPYPEAGARLQQMWEEELAAELGETRSLEVEAHLGETIDVAFKMFGAGAQLLEVDLLDTTREGLRYRINARLDFADLEGPASAMDESRLFSTSAIYVLKPETVATGEWRPLARHFPRLPDP